jgi:predicted Zn-dependent protease
MGRSFESVRMGVAELAGRWLRARRALRKEDQIFAERLAEMAKRHASEGFYAFDDPLEAAVYSVFIEILKELDGDVDP